LGECKKVELKEGITIILEEEDDVTERKEAAKLKERELQGPQGRFDLQVKRGCRVE